MKNREGAQATRRAGEFHSVQDRIRACVRALGSAALFAVATVASTPALALWDDKATIFVEEKLTSDDNVFRVSKNAVPSVQSSAVPSPQFALISTPTGDTYQTTSLGLNLDVPVSRQRFQLGYARNYVRYQQLTALDLNGYDGRAAWLWQLGNDASGHLSYSENLALASFANIVGVSPDPLKTRQGRFDGAYAVTPRWRLEAGLSGFQQRNGDPLRQVNDIDILGTDASVRYTTPASTAIGLGVRAEDGHYPKRGFAPGDPFDDAYRQYGVDLIADWTPNGVSHLTARVGRVSRRNEHLPERDFYGTAVRAQYDWKPTGKFSLTAVALQDISPYDDIRSTYVFIKAVSLRPTLSVTTKIDVSASLDYSIRDYLGDPNLAAAGTLDRTDRVRSATGTITYRPIRAVTLLASALREARSSTLPFVDYEVNVYNLSVRLAF